MHPVKRRKLDAVNSILTRPFRSPLRISTNNASTQSDAIDEQTPKRQKASVPVTATPTQLRTSTAADHGGQLPLAPARALQPSQAGPANADTLPKEYATLARKLTSLRQSLDTVQQALKVETSNQSSDLDALIRKWRSVVRDTSEELFEDAKHRVGNRGDVQNWLKQQEKEPPDMWFEERQIRLSDAQRKMLEVQREDDRAEAEKYGLIEKDELEEEETAVSSMLLSLLWAH